MKSSKNGGLLRSLSFLMIAVILIGTIGFAAGGLQSDPNVEPDSGKSDKEQNGEADENTDGKEENNKVPEEPEEPEIYIPEYVNYLTGLEVTEAVSRNRPLGFVISSNAPMYGISSTSLVFEFPIEDGTTRLLTYQTDVKSIGKIGSVTYTRQFITNIAEYFGGAIISHGNDDTVKYDGFGDSVEHFDLSEHTGYHYSEHNKFIYTNGDLINAGLSNAGLSAISKPKVNMPFNFTEFGEESMSFDVRAETVILPFSDANQTEFVYSKEQNDYLFTKDGTAVTDLINGKTTSFNNLFILFSDSVTYETSEASELVMDTVNGGDGYYITNGTACKIKWSVDDLGNMILTDTDGAKLKINRGRSYFSFFKSSKLGDISIA